MKLQQIAPRPVRFAARLMRYVGLSAVAWAYLFGTAWAQGEEEAGAADYALPYALVVLAIGLGLLVVCRESNRRERARPEQYGD